VILPDYELPMAAEYPNKKRILEPKSQRSKANLQTNASITSKTQMTITAVQAPNSMTMRRGKLLNTPADTNPFSHNL